MAPALSPQLSGWLGTSHKKDQNIFDGHCDFGRVTAKCRDVFLDPFQGETLFTSG